MPSKKPKRPQSNHTDDSSVSTSSSASSRTEVESNPESTLSLETASISSIPSDTSSSSSSSSCISNDEPLETNPVDEYFTNTLPQQTLTPQLQSLSISSSPSTANPYDTYHPLTTTSLHQSPHEIARKRTHFFLHLRAFYQGLLHDPFHEYRAISTSLLGATLPPDIYLTSPPFPPTSTRGAIRMHHIRALLSMPPSAPVSQIEGFIGRTPSVVSHLCFNIQPFSDLIFSPRHHSGHQIYVAGADALECNERLLRALKEIAWGDESGADWVVGLARREDARRLSALNAVLPHDVVEETG
ncbi:hypothetical protein V8C44DRAFT_353688 [Trichoderma aethiopicum]